jgi:ABC-type Na+ efflux pump permease subunit
MEATSNNPVRSEHVVWGRLVPAGALALVVAVAANSVVYLVASSLGAMPQDVDANGQGPITFPMVVAMSAVGAVVGTLVYALVGRFVRRPVRVFRLVSALALVLSFVGPLTIPGAPAAMVAALLVMHVVTAVIVVGLLTTLAARADGD